MAAKSVSGAVTLQGYLDKQGHYFRGWKRRYFVVRGNKMYYYMDEHSAQESGIIELVDCVVLPVVHTDPTDPTEGPFCFEISSIMANSHNRSTYRLRCSSEHELIEWVFAIRDAVTISASQWVVKHVNTPPQLMGVLVVTLVRGKNFETRNGYNILLSLDNQFARQQKIASSQPGDQTPMWDEHYSFAVWNSESRLLIRLAVRKRQNQRFRMSFRSKVKAINSVPLDEFVQAQNELSKTIELYSLGSQGLLQGSYRISQALSGRPAMMTQLEEAGNPTLDIKTRFLSLDNILGQLLLRYQGLFSVILNNKSALIVLSNHAVLKKEDEIFNIIMHIFMQSRKGLSLLSWLIHEEVEKCLDSNTLFRTDNLVTKLMSSFCRLVGANYRRKVLEAIVKGVCDDYNGYELDPNRLPAGENLEQNMHKVYNKVNEVMNSIIRQPEILPMSFLVICRVLYDEISQKFEEASAYKALSGFLFLRFLCPALVSPILFYEDDPLLVPDAFTSIRPDARRALVILGKVLIRSLCY
eukprot:TRINITY_DN6863_c0_g4_i1.p1 TRINITY_DN6863_c0_g4~~TRINITY_DN6863_c0_g4_i1.p1  ORF type:complete len:525 (-),score=100.91 TRINITY_DN6863_c0_g4_i1:68-1642(-)